MKWHGERTGVNCVFRLLTVSVRPSAAQTFSLTHRQSASLSQVTQVSFRLWFEGKLPGLKQSALLCDGLAPHTDTTRGRNEP